MGEVKKQYHVMLAFASLIPSMKEMRYYGIDGKTTFTGVQSNEAGICQVQEMLHPNGLDRIILIVSEKANQPAEIGSEADRQKWQQFLDSKKKDAMSPVDFLKARISDKYEQLKNIFIDIPYSENDSTRDSMNRIAEVAEHVQKVVDKVRETSENTGDVEIILHADMTGGFRYAAMMMLAIMQLSKYMGIKIGHILYSELPPRERPNDPGRIRLIDDIHRMFDLIAGADEFQKYGSVQALEEYFGDTEKYGEAFQELFRAMRRFSDAIRICRTSVIEQEMGELAEKIRHFRDNKGSAIEEEMFAKIIGVIEKEYGSVIINADEPEADRRLDIIAWCVRKKFLQQAMTLCSEWIPGILVEKRICYTEDLWTIRACRKRGKSSMQSWQQQFIINYAPNEKSVKVFPHGDCERMIRYILKHRKKELIKELPKEMQPKLITFFSQYETNYEKRCALSLQRDIVPNIPDFPAKYPMLKTAIDSYFKNTTQKKPLPYGDLASGLADLQEPQLFRLFGISAEDAEKYDLQYLGQGDYAAEKDKLWKKRKAQCTSMLKGEAGNHVMHTDKSIPEAIEFLHGYFNIRNERNQSNHAVKNAMQKNAALERFIADYIKKLRNE